MSCSALVDSGGSPSMGFTGVSRRSPADLATPWRANLRTAGARPSITRVLNANFSSRIDLAAGEPRALGRLSPPGRLRARWPLSPTEIHR